MIGRIYDTIHAIFEGDKRPVDLSYFMPMKWEDLEFLLRYNGCIDINGNLSPSCSETKFLGVITLYYSMKPTVIFTRKKR